MIGSPELTAVTGVPSAAFPTIMLFLNDCGKPGYLAAINSGSRTRCADTAHFGDRGNDLIAQYLRGAVLPIITRRLTIQGDAESPS